MNLLTRLRARFRATINKWLTPVSSGGGGLWHTIMDWWPGRWQQDVVEINNDEVVRYGPVFAATTLIAGDIGKLRVRLMRRSEADAYEEVVKSPFLNVLRRPNQFQTWQQFSENWIYSKLLNGNTYVLKRRKGNGAVDGLYILDPNRVRPLISDSGLVFYELQGDNIAAIAQTVLASATEIIHDRWNTLFHPLVGLSPIFACGLSATQGRLIQSNAARFFKNMSRPSGVLTAAGHIADDTAARLKAIWDERFTGENAGKVAVLGDGLKYEPMGTNAVDAQLVDQLKWTALDVAAVYHVPPFKIGAGPAPGAISDIEGLTELYFSDCLQTLIEGIENCLDDGLGFTTEALGEYCVEFDTNGLLRMTTSARFRAWGEGVKGGFMTPNEARRREGLPPVAGGDSCYLQQQNYSLEALAKRDAKDDPFGGAASAKPSEYEKLVGYQTNLAVGLCDVEERLDAVEQALAPPGKDKNG